MGMDMSWSTSRGRNIVFYIVYHVTVAGRHNISPFSNLLLVIENAIIPRKASRNLVQSYQFDMSTDLQNICSRYL